MAAISCDRACNERMGFWYCKASLGGYHFEVAMESRDTQDRQLDQGIHTGLFAEVVAYPVDGNADINVFITATDACMLGFLVAVSATCAASLIPMRQSACWISCTLIVAAP